MLPDLIQVQPPTTHHPPLTTPHPPPTAHHTLSHTYHTPQLFWNRNLTDGDIGNPSSEGYVVLSMAHRDYLQGNIDACYTVVMALDGTIVQAQVAPTQEVDGRCDLLHALRGIEAEGLDHW